MNIRVGFGYDVHRLEEGRDLVLGGVKIPYPKGLLGHSDADVLIHAICDALLGAANLRDIGYHFPDTSGEFKNISSILLLKNVIKMIREKGLEVHNIDSTIVLQQPKITEYIHLMKENIAAAISCDVDVVSVKATTTEHLGFIGREEGISAYAVILVKAIQ